MLIHFVTGKGGVGKTRTALLLSKENPKAILAETSDGLKFEAKELGFKSPPIHRFTRSDLHREFLISTVKIPLLAKFLGSSKMFQSLLELAPNLTDLLYLKEWLQLSEDQPLIVDAPSTGHFISLFESTRMAKVLFDGGSLRPHIEKLQERFESGRDLRVSIISLPEKSSLEESEQIETWLKKNYPKIEVERFLNRKHTAPKSVLEISDELKKIAYDRPLKEDLRIAGKSFEKILAEGALSL